MTRRRSAALVAVLLLLRSADGLAECATTICAGDPCTITGTHVLDAGCVLDFQNKTVTIAGSAVLKAATAGGDFTIQAGNLTVQGLLQAPGGDSAVYPTIGIAVTGDFKTASANNSPGTIDVKANGPATAGSIDISADGNVTIAGKDISADGGTAADGGTISISGASITTTGTIHANSVNGGTGGDITLSASDADIVVGGNITANGGGSGANGGTITVGSEFDLVPGTITVTARLQADGTQGGSGNTICVGAEGAVTINGAISNDGAGEGASGGTITVTGDSITTQSAWTANAGSNSDDAQVYGGTITLTSTAGAIAASSSSSFSATAAGGGNGGTVDFEATGDATIGGNVTVTAAGVGAVGGMIFVVAGGSQRIDVSGTLDARSTSTNSSSYDGCITIGPACHVQISGTLRNRNTALTGGLNIIEYHGSFDATGATILADNDSIGGNTINCRCADIDSQGMCGSPLHCETVPFLGSATVNPAPAVTPKPFGPCTGCPNGVVDSPGEQCDDGNYVNGDGCDIDCTLTRCGNGIQTFPEECDDGNAVDGDGCDSNCKVTGCGNGIVTTGEECDDGNLVNGDCCSSTCTAEPAGGPCPGDGNPCTDDFCNATGSCVAVNNTDPCDDGNVCTQSDVCQDGACTGTPVSDGLPCDDGNLCTVADQCSDGLCGGAASTGCCCVHSGAGCDASSCEQCVCTANAFGTHCCSEPWDSICVFLAESVCSPVCACASAATATPTATNTANDTATPTLMPTLSPTTSPTETAIPTPTASDTPTATATATPTATLTVTATAIPTATLTPTAVPPCLGDCDGEHHVTSAEVLQVVNAALGHTGAGGCPAGLPGVDGSPTVAEVIGAINNAHSGCDS